MKDIDKPTQVFIGIAVAVVACAAIALPIYRSHQEKLLREDFARHDAAAAAARSFAECTNRTLTHDALVELVRYEYQTPGLDFAESDPQLQSFGPRLSETFKRKRLDTDFSWRHFEGLAKRCLNGQPIADILRDHGDFGYYYFDALERSEPFASVRAEVAEADNAILEPYRQAARDKVAAQAMRKKAEEAAAFRQP